MNNTTTPEANHRPSRTALKCFVIWLGKVFMTKCQRDWLDRLSVYSDWKYDKSDPSHTAVVSIDGHTAYLECDAVRIRDKDNKIVCSFDIDWLFARKIVCNDLATSLAR